MSSVSIQTINITSSWVDIFPNAVNGLYGIMIEELEKDCSKGTIFILSSGNTTDGYIDQIMLSNGFNVRPRTLPGVFKFDVSDTDKYEIRKSNTNILQVKRYSGTDINVKFTLYDFQNIYSSLDNIGCSSSGISVGDGSNGSNSTITFKKYGFSNKNLTFDGNNINFNNDTIATQNYCDTASVEFKIVTANTSINYSISTSQLGSQYADMSFSQVSIYITELRTGTLLDNKYYYKRYADGTLTGTTTINTAVSSFTSDNIQVLLKSSTAVAGVESSIHDLLIIRLRGTTVQNKTLYIKCILTRNSNYLGTIVPNIFI